MHARLLKQVGSSFIGMSFATRVSIACLMVFLILGTAGVVYAAGGSRVAYLHFMYIPIALSGIAFGVPGGILAAIAAGLVIGPYMPINVMTGEMQTVQNWLSRIFFFVLIGGLVGTWQTLLRRHIAEVEWLHDHHDDTGLLNFIGLMKRLNTLIQRASKDQQFSVSILQLNDFLEIQNTFGRGFGMRVIAEVIARTRRLVPSGALVALIQPDRLATVVPGESSSHLQREKIEEVFRESYLIDGVPIHVEASVGVAHFPDHGSTPEELLQKAGIAMHWAASSASPISIYNSVNDRTSRENLILLGELPEAIAGRQLKIWHQAKVKLATNEVSGTEALLRWEHPARGMIPPGLFIPQVEETSLINAVTQTVIADALADAGSWRAAGLKLRVSVNLSVRNLHDNMFLETLQQNTLRNGLRPSDVDLEIVESAVMADPEYCIQLIKLLREHGYGVSIDDFGTGQSSLAYLQKLHVSCLKIDQSFVRTLSSDTHNQKIVQAILHLAKALGLETVAEGIEDEASCALLREWGCDYGQGYGLHRPAPSQDFLGFLEKRESV